MGHGPNKSPTTELGPLHTKTDHYIVSGDNASSQNPSVCQLLLLNSHLSERWSTELLPALDSGSIHQWRLRKMSRTSLLTSSWRPMPLTSNAPARWQFFCRSILLWRRIFCLRFFCFDFIRKCLSWSFRRKLLCLFLIPLKL